MSTWMPRAIGLGAGVVAGVAAYDLLARPAMQRWGATDAELRAVLPGDELVPDAGPGTTRAVSVGAPADAVWPWLVQVGVGRGGWYSYDLLERAIGVPIHNTRELRDEWQDLAVGDRVVLAPPGWMGLPDGYVLPVARLEPGRALVLRQQPPEHPWDGIWSFHVVPVDDHRCRLIARSRTVEAQGAARIPAAVGAMVGDAVTFVMERRMLLGIKERAERQHASDQAARMLKTVEVLLDEA